MRCSTGVAAFRSPSTPAFSPHSNRRTRVPVRSGAGARSKSLYVAVTESDLVSDVKAGENRGARFAHDHVARAWIGPLRLRDGDARVQRRIALPGTWHPGNLAIVAFVQDDTSGTVPQAAAARDCPAK